MMPLSQHLPENDSRSPWVFLRLLRVTHWIKNVFVFLPLPFALATGAELDPLSFLFGLSGFCLLNSSVYILNDVKDRHRDAEHPSKRYRPVASGEVSLSMANKLSFILGILGMLLLGFGAYYGGCNYLDFRETILSLPGIGLTYFIANVIYTVWVRSVVWLDVIFLGLFFLLRLILGCSLSGVYPSAMLLMTGFSLALMMAIGKRYSELSSGLGSVFRNSLGTYSTGTLAFAFRGSALISLLGYGWYCWSSPLMDSSGWWWSICPVAIGLMKYHQEVIRAGGQIEPVELVLGSYWPILVLGLWVVSLMTSMN